jgi:uncharacterized protein (TIGR02996 family)
VTRDEMEREVASLLLEQRRLARFDLKLSPDALLRLERLLYRLGLTKGVPMSRTNHVTRRKYRKPLVVSYADSDLATTKPTPVTPVSKNPDRRPTTGTGVLDGGLPRVDLDLQLFKQHVRAKHAGGGPNTVRPNTPEERALLTTFAQQRGLKVAKSPYSYYDEQSHTLYHPTPEDRAAVGESYVKHGEGKVKLDRRVRRYARPDETTHNGLITAIRSQPEDATPRLGFADFLQENGIPGAHIVREHAEGILGGTRTGRTPPERGSQFSRMMVLGKRRRYGGNTLPRYNDTITGETRELPIAQIAYRPGRVAISVSHVGNPEETPTGHNQGTRVTHGVEVRDIEHLRHLTQDWPQWARQEAERVAGGSFTTPTQMSRRRYAKADTRHVAHPLIAGFPLEHVLRHLANDASASSQLRDTAKHVLTTGDTSGLWGLHDLVHEHENVDGTTGHPILKAGYNFMSAADKVQLDKHVHTALHEEGERERKRQNAGPNDESPAFTPEHHALRRAYDLHNGVSSREHQDAMKRIRSRVYSLSGEKDNDKVNESLGRHAYRAMLVHRSRANISPEYDKERSLQPVTKGMNDEHTHTREVATRYARLTLSAPRPWKSPLGKEGFEHDYHDETGTKLGVLQTRYYPDEKRVHVHYVGKEGAAAGDPEQANTLSAAVRTLGPEIAKHYPEAETLSGFRAGGFRKGKGEGVVKVPISRVNRLRRRVVSVKYAEQTPQPVSHDRPPSGFETWSDARHYAVGLVRSGTPRDEVARTLGLHLGHLEQWLTRMGVPPEPKLSNPTRKKPGPQPKPQRPVKRGPVATKQVSKNAPPSGFEATKDAASYAAALVRSGMPREQVAAHLGVPHSTVNRWAYGVGRKVSVTPGKGYVPETTDRTQSVPSESSQLSRRRYAKPNRSDFLDALRRMKSSNHTALTDSAVSVAGRMGMNDTKVLPALHDTPHGAVPGVAQAVYGNAKPETVHALAAWVNGLLPNGPGYAVFHARPTGPDTLYRIRHEGSGMDLRVRLDRAGITSRVLIPHRKGFDVLVPDKGNKLAPNVDAYAKQHGLSVEASPGHFQTVGSSDQGQARAAMRNKVVQGERQQMRRTGNVRRYTLDINETIRQGVENSRRRNTRDGYTQNVTSGGILADAMDEAGEPHAPFFRNLVNGASYATGMSTVHGPLTSHTPPARTHPLGGYTVADNGFHWAIRATRGGRDGYDAPFAAVHRYVNPSGEMPTHTAVMDAPSLREWAAHPKVGASLRAALVNAADHLEGQQQEPERKSRSVSRPFSPKRYADVPTKEGEEWIKDFKVPVSYDSPAGNVGVAHYAPKRSENGRWAWSQLEHLGHVRDHETAKELFPHVMHEDEFFGHHTGDEVNAAYLTPEEVHLATDGREGTAPQAAEQDYRPDHTTPEDFYAMRRTGNRHRYAEVPPALDTHNEHGEEYHRDPDVILHAQRVMSHRGADGKPVPHPVRVIYRPVKSVENEGQPLQWFWHEDANHPLTGTGVSEEESKVLPLTHNVMGSKLPNQDWVEGLHSGAPGVDYRPNETIPEDFYAMSRRRAVKYAKVPQSEEGVLSPEQLAIAQRAAETGDLTAWGALGDHLAENGYPNTGGVISKFATGHPDTHHAAGPGVGGWVPEGSNFRYAVYRDGSDLVHVVNGILPNKTRFSFHHRQRPQPTADKLSRRRRAVTCP